MSITFAADRRVTPQQFVDLLRNTSLGERRPIHDLKCIGAMLDHADLLCTAWDETMLVGVARSVTDFAFCCYLSDLAVHERYQRRGIGRELIRLTRSRLGPHAKLLLLSAPNAEQYYPRLGFEAHRSAWFLSADKPLR
jgi:GNAT superfamily N-acetyltransferase